MLVETSAHGSDLPARPRVSGGRVHDDAPDTASNFVRLAELPHGPERDALRDELTRAWLPMAHRIAGRFRNRGESLEDLRQVAALGLVKAIDRYEPGRGAFESYAVPTITGEIKRHFRDRMWALRVPRRVQELRNKVRIARRELTESGSGATASVADIAAHTGLTEDEVNAGLEEAVAELIEVAAKDAACGILVTRLHPGRYTVALDRSVPFGETYEALAA